MHKINAGLKQTIQFKINNTWFFTNTPLHINMFKCDFLQELQKMLSSSEMVCFRILVFLDIMLFSKIQGILK